MEGRGERERERKNSSRGLYKAQWTLEAEAALKGTFNRFKG